MNDNVVPFKPTASAEEEQFVWICGCGCQSFRLLSDGAIECCQCENQCNAHSEWRRDLPDPPDEVERDTSGTIIHTALGVPELARRRVLKTLDEWARDDELLMVAAYHKDGTGKHWLGIETQEDKDEVLDKLLDLIQDVRSSAV